MVKNAVIPPAWRDSMSREIVHWLWLCDTCSHTMTVVPDNHREVTVAPLAIAELPRQRTVITVTDVCPK
jgi:hypothetical protein